MRYYSTISEEQQRLLDSFLTQKLPAEIHALQSFIRFPSVKAPPTNNCPFGPHMQNALNFVLSEARSLGLCVRDLDGFLGIAEYGDGEEALGILVHVDVVPAGEGWTFHPFAATIHDDRIYGRGAIDNKGPAICALYALSAVIAANIPLKRKVQVIFGCDEESGWSCMEYYKKKETLPSIAFSPDAEYPLICAEKNILHGMYMRKHTGTRLRIRCGERVNVVPGLAEAYIEGVFTSIPALEGFTIDTKEENGETFIRVTGLSAHASTPECGKNALQALLKVLAALELSDMDAKAIRVLADAFQLDMHGEALGLDVTDESGRLTLNPAILHWEQDKAMLGIDVRAPHCISGEEVFGKITEGLSPAAFAQEKTSVSAGYSVPKDSFLVESLMGVYQAHTGDTQSAPLAIGGGTYARAIKNAVGFGCQFPGAPNLAHMPNEYFSIEDIQKNTRIMADAIIALAGK